MNFDLDLISSNAIIVVPIIVALIQAIKLTGKVPDYYAPLLSIGIGIAIGWLGNYGAPDFHFGSTALSGVCYGLMASGLYSTVKTTYVARVRQKAEQERKKHTHSDGGKRRD